MDEDRAGDGGDAMPDDEDRRDDPEVREAQEAHGGSMAPSLVDETGHPVLEPPPAVSE
jgi:hypothetical protein